MRTKINILFIALTISLLSAISTFAGTGDWKIYRAYQEASIVAETPRLVFAVFDGSLLSYNPEDSEIRTYSTLTGLHDNDIRFMTWCADASSLVLVYSNGNIDIMVGENDIFNISSIKDNTTIRDKTINNLEVYGGMAYVSTAFGVVAIDVANRVISGTYRFDVSTTAVCINDGYIYASTAEGLKKAALDSNLLDRENWRMADDIYQADNILSASKIAFFDNRFLYLAQKVLRKCRPNEAPEIMLANVSWIAFPAGKLAVFTGKVYLYTDLSNYSLINENIAAIDFMNTDGTLWAAIPGKGVAGIKIAKNAAGYETVVDEIKVNSPKRNSVFALLHTAGKLFVTGGGRGAYNYNYPGTLMIFENGRWTNLDEELIEQQTGLPCRDFISVVADPLDANHYYVGSWGEGLYEFKNDEFVKLYSLDNSSLESSIAGNNRFVRIDGLVYDSNRNLWMINNEVSDGLAVLTSDGKWQNFYAEALTNAQLSRIIIAADGKKWFNIWRTDRAGIVVLDENNQQIAYSQRFTDNLNTDLTASYFLCMAEDLRGDIWVGTDNGPIILSSADDVNNGRCYRRTVRDQYGSAKYMLDKERVNAIAVDGGNRKWVGTQNSGLFVIDESKGDIPQVDNYNTSNSHLLSDNIVALAIDPVSGELFIGTDKGICSLITGATEGNPDYSNVYAFPNPVTSTGNGWTTITGLIQNSTVKITDMAGNVVAEGLSQGGQYTWNMKNRSGHRVKAGIYLVFASTADGSQGVVTKVMVIR
jgi:hypothetical protein